MSRIRLLSEQVANQIAAGEVVDRPAAVVKELAENSLDAGATRIDIAIEGGGAGLIRVADDGCGMDKDDVLLCLERHATSKLREASELEGIKSLGFRGEAIPSIASVSWLTILSRQRDAPLGARAEVRHGQLKEVREEGCACGTVMEARQLFANMPARKKFLKSGRTELFHMEEAVKNLALANPQVAFSLRVEGKSVLNCPAGESPEVRMRPIFRWKEDLIAVDAEAGGMALSGFLLPPEKTAATNAKLRLFVNGRAVTDNMLRFAARDALQGHLLRGCQPAGMLALTLPPGEVDVNVHPAKREIRFRNAEAARRLVSVAVVASSLVPSWVYHNKVYHNRLFFSFLQEQQQYRVKQFQLQFLLRLPNLCLLNFVVVVVEHKHLVFDIVVHLVVLLRRILLLPLVLLLLY